MLLLILMLSQCCEQANVKPEPSFPNNADEFVMCVCTCVSICVSLCGECVCVCGLSMCVCGCVQ